MSFDRRPSRPWSSLAFLAVREQVIVQIDPEGVVEQVGRDHEPAEGGQRRRSGRAAGEPPGGRRARRRHRAGRRRAAGRRRRWFAPNRRAAERRGLRRNRSAAGERTSSRPGNRFPPRSAWAKSVVSRSPRNGTTSSRRSYQVMSDVQGDRRTGQRALHVGDAAVAQRGFRRAQRGTRELASRIVFKGWDSCHGSSTPADCAFRCVFLKITPVIFPVHW